MHGFLLMILALANRLSFYLLIFILGLFILENLSRKKAKYHTPSKGGFKSKSLTTLNGYKSTLALTFCTIVFFISFLFPVLQMLYWTIIFPKHLTDLNLIELFFNTILLVFLSSVMLISLAFISNYGNRVSRSKFLQLLTTFSISGYAIPGIILAVAFITFISWFDKNIINFFGFNTIKSFFIGSILGLVIVYFVRFFSLASNGLKSAYLKINYSIDESAYLLGYSKFKTFKNVHIPYLKNSILLIGILIAIEIIKELPITLIMRPFNFETFATTAYIFASQDLLESRSCHLRYFLFLLQVFLF